MPEEPEVTRNQHFVPRFYLERFSVDGNNRQIRTLVVNRDIFQPITSIKGQASKSYYYGKDGVIDNSLCSTEGEFAKLLRRIDKGETPKINTRLYKDLLRFAIHIDFRNPIRDEGMREILRTASLQVASHIVGGQFDNLRLTAAEARKAAGEVLGKLVPKFQSQAVGQMISAVDIAVANTDDLFCKIIENKTDLPFVTSDYPTVLYNQFLERTSSGNNVGLLNKGLQIFIPIASNVLILFYDPNIYGIDERNSRRVFLRNKEDVTQLNLLQMYNCNHVVFGNEQFTREYALELKRKMILPKTKLRNDMKVQPINLTLSLVEFTPMAKYYFSKETFRILRQRAIGKQLPKIFTNFKP